jgi:hypothetical protein
MSKENAPSVRMSGQGSTHWNAHMPGGLSLLEKENDENVSRFIMERALFFCAVIWEREKCWLLFVVQPAQKAMFSRTCTR